MALVLLEVEMEFDANEDGNWTRLEGFPFVRRQQVEAIHPFYCVTKAGEDLSPFKLVGNQEIGVVELAVLVADGACTYRLDNQADGGIDMLASQNALILCDSEIDSGALSNIAAPGSGNTVKIYGFIGGQPAVVGECLGYGEGGYGEGGYGCGAAG